MAWPSHQSNLEFDRNKLRRQYFNIFLLLQEARTENNTLKIFSGYIRKSNTLVTFNLIRNQMKTYLIIQNLEMWK